MLVILIAYRIEMERDRAIYQAELEPTFSISIRARTRIDSIAALLVQHIISVKNTKTKQLLTIKHFKKLQKTLQNNL